MDFLQFLKDAEYSKFISSHTKQPLKNINVKNFFMVGADDYHEFDDFIDTLEGLGFKVHKFQSESISQKEIKEGFDLSFIENKISAADSRYQGIFSNKLIWQMPEEFIDAFLAINKVKPSITQAQLDSLVSETDIEFKKLGKSLKTKDIYVDDPAFFNMAKNPLWYKCLAKIKVVKKTKP